MKKEVSNNGMEEWMLNFQASPCLSPAMTSHIFTLRRFAFNCAAVSRRPKLQWEIKKNWCGSWLWLTDRKGFADAVRGQPEDFWSFACPTAGLTHPFPDRWESSRRSRTGLAPWPQQTWHRLNCAEKLPCWVRGLETVALEFQAGGA